MITSIYLLVSVILLFVIFWPEVLKTEFLPKITRIILFLVLLMDLIVFKSFFELKFRITNEGLEFGYGLFKNKLNHKDIESVIIESSRGFIGYGIRFDKEKTMGYIAQSGEGLKITLKDQRSFFITMHEPEQALDIIKQNNYVSC